MTHAGAPTNIFNLEEINDLTSVEKPVNVFDVEEMSEWKKIFEKKVLAFRKTSVERCKADCVGLETLVEDTEALLPAHVRVDLQGFYDNNFTNLHSIMQNPYADGNCFYRALSLGLTDHERSHIVLRILAAEEVFTNLQWYITNGTSLNFNRSLFLREILGGFREFENICMNDPHITKTHLGQMSADSVIAMSNALGRPIIIYGPKFVKRGKTFMLADQSLSCRNTCSKDTCGTVLPLRNMRFDREALAVAWYTSEATFNRRCALDHYVCVHRTPGISFINIRLIHEYLLRDERKCALELLCPHPNTWQVSVDGNNGWKIRFPQ